MKPSFTSSGLFSGSCLLLLVFFSSNSLSNPGSVPKEKRPLHSTFCYAAPAQQQPDSTPTFPGGATAWMRYLNRNFHYPDAAVQQGIEGTVVVQFTVDSTGNVSDIHVVSGPESGGLREHTEWIIRHSGKWVPAYKDGIPVTTTKKQPVIFRLG